MVARTSLYPPLVGLLVVGVFMTGTATALAQQFGSSSGSSFPPRRAAISAESATTRSPPTTRSSTTTRSSSGSVTVGSEENYFQRRPRTTSPPQNRVVDQRGQARSFQPRSGSVAVSKGSGQLPSDAGQVWREYDIAPYTLNVKGKNKPEQAIVDWILRETGTDVWFSSPVGLLSADSRTLRCYHTPQMQQVVQGVVERFVSGDVESQVLGIRVMTISSPNWRTRALPLLKSVDVKSPGVEAWLLTKENAAVLVADLRRQAGYRELNAPNLQIHSGQTETIAKTHPRTYVRSIRAANVFPGYETVTGQIDEGFALQVSPLMSLDGRACDVVIKCNIDQVEKFVPINLDMPAGVTTQRVQIQVPQFVSWRLHERFRWPSDQVLLLSCGVVANPTGESATALSVLPMVGGPSRADALMMIEHKGRTSQNPVEFVPASLPPAAAANTAPPFAATSPPAASTAMPPPSSYINTRGRY